MCGGAPSCMKVIESRHWCCSIWGATKFSSMFLYLLAVTVQVTGPLRVVSSKKKDARMNVAVNTHQTVTFGFAEKSDVECKDLVNVPLTCQSTFLECMEVSMPFLHDGYPYHQILLTIVVLLRDPDENPSRVTVQTE
ncbi:hypothetical protein TNCV_3964711 [Trichonephila clavipes]|nr:hypothetical protein TNCV_3964711 [Trichonephila clavipes]